MIDLFESIIKMHTVVILSEYVAENKLSESAKGLLAQGLRTPSLGTWQLFSRVLFEELEKDQFAWSLPLFAKEFADLDKALNNEKTNVIAFRNGYAHGATPTDEACAADISKFEPFLTKLLQAQWLLESSLEVVEGKVFLCSNDEKLSLHPILLHRDENTEASFAFFNDLKNDKIGLLNYPLGKHYREKEFLNEFHQYIPINEWKKTGANEFQQRIEELTETFKGRTAERKQLLNFVVEKQKGYCSIQGNPGIGKSALIAQFFKDLRLHDSCKDIQVIEYFIRRGTQQAKPEVLLEYLIKKTDELFPKAREIRAEGKMVFDLQNQLFTKWRLWAEHCKGTKLLFLIDGLDEGVEENIIQYLPKENFQNILFIYGSRPGGHKSIDELWGNLPVEHHLKIELSGLGKEDIRAMIYEVANKYEIEKDSAWIEAIQQRSQGNPLYLKLLCDALANKSIGLNDINALPKEIDEYYKAILFRFAQDSVDGDALLDSLYTFAAAKDYLSFAHIGLINKLGEAKLQRIGSTLKEVLIENPLTENVLDYQLFHESFREYLFKEKSFKITEANEQIINYCASWKELEGNWEQRYALEFYADHLCESQKAIHHETLLKLIEDKAFLHTQKEVLRHFKASNKLMQLAIEKSAELKNQDTLLEAALCLVDLKYEEDNDAPRILEMIANGEIDIALLRIEAFGTNDKEGLERKFILYMLCLMELTLLESKDKSFRKKAIEKLLKHLDENLPIDHSILNWNDFFSSYLIFQMACEWAELGLDYLIVYKRTEFWIREWIPENGPYNNIQFEVLHTFARDNESDKIRALVEISTELAKQGKEEEAASTIQEALTCAVDINDELYKSSALREIYIELIKQGKIGEALDCAKGSSEVYEVYNNSDSLMDISKELAKQGKVEDAESVLQEALVCAMEINDESFKISALRDISIELVKQGKLNEALTCVMNLNDESDKIRALVEISTELAKQDKEEEAASTIQEALVFAMDINDESFKSSALKDISIELVKQGKLDEALTCAMNINDESDKSSVLREISIELAKKGKVVEAVSYAMDINDGSYKSSALRDISIELAKQGKVGEAVLLAIDINDESCKSSALVGISIELARQEKVDEAVAFAMDIADESYKSIALMDISTELAKQGNVEEALSCAMDIYHDDKKIETLLTIALELNNLGKAKDALELIQETYDLALKFEEEHLYSVLFDIAKVFAEIGNIEKYLFVNEQIILKCADIYFCQYIILKIQEKLLREGNGNLIPNIILKFIKKKKTQFTPITKDKYLLNISLTFINQDNIGMAFLLLNEITDNLKNEALIEFSKILIEKDKIIRKRIWDETFKDEDSGEIVQFQNIEYEFNDNAFQIFKIRKKVEFKNEEEFDNFSKIKNMEIEFDLMIQKLDKINDLHEKIEAYVSLSNLLYNQEFFESAIKAISHALNIINVSPNLEACFLYDQTFIDLFEALIKQGQFIEAYKIINLIEKEHEKNRLLVLFSIEAATNNLYEIAYEAIMKIDNKNDEFKAWIKLGKLDYSKKGIIFCKNQIKNLPNITVIYYYLKGIAVALNPSNADESTVSELLILVKEDTNSIAHLMQMHTFYLCFFEKTNSLKMQRLNKTLNIQWAIDIAAKFEKEFSRSSHNIQEWINQIADENDREDILGWAEKVQQGKMTEEKFLERINKL